VQLGGGGTLSADYVVNAAGCWSGAVSKLVAMDLPVNPMRRFEHFVEIEEDLPPMPLLKDPERLVVRPEGNGYSVGLVNSNEPRGFNFDVDHTWFERVVWPALAARIPAFESLKLRREWSGLYDECDFDGNMILGNWPGRLDNFFVACGFSGHGLMHAPAIGRALSELIVDGRFETIDLSRLGYQRVLEGRPCLEVGII
jgi:glycine/D-amino acid oxidase-like deaminating enzyme